MFVDELTFTATAGNGGDGVVRWLREAGRPLGGPSGGNGGRGGDVFIRAVRDLGLLVRYRSEKEFNAQSGAAGMGKSKYGKGGDDFIIDLPVGSIVTDRDRGNRFELLKEGQIEKILSGGNGGLGNEYFKSAINRQPTESTKGKAGEYGVFDVELELAVDAGFVGLPNAGKSSLLNALTNASSKVGAYPFTTLEPHLGDLYGFVLADIPGLIEGAAEGKGLGHKFLRHVRRTKMLLHCVPADSADVVKTYHEVRNEILKFDATMKEKTEWILLTKTDMVSADELKKKIKKLKPLAEKVVPITVLDDTLVKKLLDLLVTELRRTDSVEEGSTTKKETVD